MLHALLIGINDYHPAARVRPLTGCLNDVAAVRQFLLDFHADQLPDPAAQIQTLLNAEADRKNTLEKLRGMAEAEKSGPGDLVLLYFSGHGSWATTAPAFQPFVPDAREEGWVLYDSRAPGGFDLADKEIAVLLEAIARNGADVAVIADSCHSGSVTRSAEEARGWRPRFTPGSREPRPLDSYLDGFYQKQLAETGRIAVPAARHLLFAACDKTEVAWESDERCGVFTKNLLAAARSAGGQLAWAEAFAEACAALRVFTRQQNPQAEVFGGFNPRGGFLGKILPDGDGRRRRFAVQFDAKRQTGIAKIGAAQGLCSDAGEAVWLEIFDAPAAGAALGTVALTHLGATESQFNPGNVLPQNPTKTWWAEPLAMPLPAFEVVCEDPATLFLLQTELEKRPESPLQLVPSDGNPPDGNPVFSKNGTSDALLALRPENGNIALYRTADGAFVHGVEAAADPAAAHRYILGTLEQAAAHTRLAALQNRRSRLPAAGVSMRFEVLGDDGQFAPLDGPTANLPFNGQPIAFRLTLENRSGRDLFFALVHLDAQFGSQILWHDTAKIRSGGPPVEVMFPGGNDFYLPDGTDSETDILKLIASTEPIEPAVFSKETLPKAIVSPERGSGFRAIGSTLAQPDWLTKTLTVRTIRTASEAMGRVGERAISLAGGQIQIGAHAAFRGDFNLAAPEPPGSRSAAAGGSPLADFFVENQHVALVSLAQTRGGGEVPFLDISGIRGAETLAENPLEINLLTENFGPEKTPGFPPLPFFFDGEHFLPAGTLAARPDGSGLDLKIRHIPDENPALRTRSVGKSLRLFFLQFAHEKTGLALGETHALRWVDFSAPGPPERRSEGLFEKVKSAKKVLLLLHGILGDTQKMLEPMRFAEAESGFLVLTFDYENLHTPIEKTALALRDRLRAAGFVAGESPKLTLVAHSLGGLVARHFLEKLDGAAFAERLICCGTPHGGTRFGSVPDWLNGSSVLLGLGIQYFQWSLPALAGLVSALQFSKEQLLVTLAQMKAGSDFLRQLDAGPSQTPVPYHLIAADVEQFFAKNAAATEDFGPENPPGFFDKVLRQTGHWAYRGEANDAAVGTASIFRVPAGDKMLVAGHHLNYFEAGGESWAALRRLL